MKIVPFARKKNGCCRGFILMEVILAAGIFAMAGIAIAVALNDLAKVYHKARELEEIRVGLESRLAEARVGRIYEMREQSDPDAHGVVYEKTVAQLQLSNDDKIVLTNLYQISINAKWRNELGPQEEKVDIYIYQP